MSRLILAGISFGLILASVFVVKGASYPLSDGTVLEGEPLSFNRQGLVVKRPDGTFAARVPWTNFTQATLKELYQEPKAKLFVAPYVEISRSEIKMLTIENDRLKSKVAVLESENLQLKRQLAQQESKSSTNSVVVNPLGATIPEDEYFPSFRNGSRREYEVECLAPLVGVQKGRLAYRIDGTETINGKTYLKEVAVFSGIPGLPAETRYVRKDKQGIYAINGVDTTKTECLDTPFPLQVGNGWTVKTAKGEAHYRVEAIETLQLFDRKYD